MTSRFVCRSAGLARTIIRASRGVSVRASTSEISTAADSVNESALKNCPTTPDSRPSGTKTTTVVSVEPVTGAINSFMAD